MSSASYVASQTIDGHQAAENALRDLGATIASPDLLHERLQAILLTREPEKLRAWCRAVQKRLERSVA